MQLLCFLQFWSFEFGKINKFLVKTWQNSINFSFQHWLIFFYSSDLDKIYSLNKIRMNFIFKTFLKTWFPPKKKHFLNDTYHVVPPKTNRNKNHSLYLLKWIKHKTLSFKIHQQLKTKIKKKCFENHIKLFFFHFLFSFQKFFSGD